MSIEEYKEKISLPLRQATLVYLIKDNLILLAMKKRGFGVGKWNGVGGKLNPGETIKEAAIRETKEEINITPTNMRQVAILSFYTPDNPEWNQEVTVFEVDTWEGKPQETEEMSPQWFERNKIPYDSMWPDDKYWFPLVLSGKIIKADFMFSENGELSDYRINQK